MRVIFERELPGYDDTCLVRALGDPKLGALTFRTSADDFVVEELPAYLPSGEGDHLYLLIEKRNVSTPAVVERLRRGLGLKEQDIGYAGRKDERGVTRQWMSIPAQKLSGQPDTQLTEVLGEGVAVLESKRHRNKLRLGHLRGNRFTIRLAADVDVDALRERAVVVGRGIPNLFGAQRFGPDNATLRQAEAFVSRSRPARSKRDEFLVSAVQSALFNGWLADRVDDGTWRKPLVGDVLLKTENGAPFICTDPDVDGARAARGEVVVGGPLVGAAMRPAESEAMTRESRSWERLGVHMDELRAHPAFDVGARRPACLVPGDVAVDREASGVTLRFSLPKGAYASVVLRALVGPALVDAAFLDHAG